MTTMLFVNLPVSDVARSKRFFTALGFDFDVPFCDQGTLCMNVNPHTKVMLHKAPRFAGYAATPVLDPASGRETVLAVSAASRAEVDTRADAALRNGGSALRDPEDLGFMYCRSFSDPDGHAWEIVWMDPTQIGV